ncbi:MAG: tRNA (adenosine(37)-N6)-threonylcarbamoyltransferase complex transferase subunit TsaD [Thermodesulfovibrio sp.]|nr:tRNA (adenosine(37)-N6)-threonylcarbamoyltransferase complex transferase subunit TsaD [Thermodesulfovibrio sp.]
MLILGIDTSCDDTSAAVVEDGFRILSNIVSGQEEIHAKYGGIVPELASRQHIEMIAPVVDEALKTAGVTLDDLGAVAVCFAPGLIGSLLVGCSFAKALAYARNIPLVAVNHLEGHLLSPFLQSPQPEFPFLSLIVSGGHTSLYAAEDFGRYTELGRTRDDAAGEAYDKVSKMLGCGYPGGPIIDLLAAGGNPVAIDFPRAYLPESLDFSFSGLKTAVLNYIRSRGPRANGERRLPELPEPMMADIAASFQKAVVDVLIRKTQWAVEQKGIKRVALAGGVAANRGLRKRMQEMGDEHGVQVFVPPVSLCTDNAAMIAAAGYHRALKKEFSGPDLNPRAHLPLG